MLLIKPASDIDLAEPGKRHASDQALSQAGWRKRGVMNHDRHAIT
jgi:hypothetical protein